MTVFAPTPAARVIKVMIVNIGVRASLRRTCLSWFMKDSIGLLHPERDCGTGTRIGRSIRGIRQGAGEVPRRVRAEQQGGGRRGQECRNGSAKPRNGAWRANFRKNYLRMLFSFDGSAFAGDEDGCWRCDVEFFRVIAFVDGDADSAAGIDVEKQIADGDVHEGLDVGERDELFVDLDTDFVAEVVAELLEFIARNVGDQRAVRVVEADDVSFDAFLSGG